MAQCFLMRGLDAELALNLPDEVASGCSVQTLVPDHHHDLVRGVVRDVSPMAATCLPRSVTPCRNTETKRPALSGVVLQQTEVIPPRGSLLGGGPLAWAAALSTY